MDMTTRQERKDILRQIDKLEIGRCGDCAGYTAYHIAVKCKCTSAVGIRELGDALIATTHKTRKNRIDDYIEQVKANGLTLEIYTALREQDISNLKMRNMIGWTQQKLDDWRASHKLDKAERQPVPPPLEEGSRETGKIAERKGLTVEGYLNARKIGYFDQDIREKYHISRAAMLDFKKRHGLALPRGHNSKYAHTNKREEVGV